MNIRVRQVGLVGFILFSNFTFAQNSGLSKPQDIATLPVSQSPFSVAIKKNKQPVTPLLTRKEDNIYLLEGGWEMIAANSVEDRGAAISRQNFLTTKWFHAVVPGTVLTTLVNSGIYPDPAYGINNISIPDTLCRQQWWYRTDLNIEKDKLSRTAILTFNGINYIADIWLNGKNIGTIKGAFQRGIFDISNLLQLGKNTIAVLISPPPHPGIPHEESSSAGTGPNGGALCADGPTFISSEGWDWVPGIRDRNIGIWQNVTLKFTSPVLIEDPQVITKISLPDTADAFITIRLKLHNTSDRVQYVNVMAGVEDKKANQPITIEAGQIRDVVFSPDNFSSLHFNHPRLWWPNGYGNPEMYKLVLTAETKEKKVDKCSIRFGIREITYELSVDAPKHPAVRIEYRPAEILPILKRAPFDNTVRRKIEGETYIPSLANGVNESIFTSLKDTAAAPYLVVRVNGKRIFCKGGNWGMDDYMKRVSKITLEPYFRLHRDAHFNMIRNWTGESTEEIFYQLCDEYGLLVWNDFWMSTEGYNIEPTDNKLFLANVKEVIHRFRNHPSIAIWCARNEGYAPPGLEDSLASIIATEDGTRHYQPNSRYLNLRTSGPWHYLKQPAQYFTSIAEGFSTELGTPSVPTAHTMRKMMDNKDVWPIKDVWFYHDLHDGQKVYRSAIDSLYGEARDLNDFCYKAQLVNYDSHRAMFESWNNKLFNKASGLLLWMTHPAWPSTVWQVYSCDYETFGSYFGSLKACEPVHVQMNLNDNKVVAVNTTLHDLNEVKVTLNCFDLNGKNVFSQETTKNVLANEATAFFTPVFPFIMPDVYLVRVILRLKNDSIVSLNDYWKTSSTVKNYLALKQASQPILSFKKIKETDNLLLFSIHNSASVTAVSIKLNLVANNTGTIVLPAYFSDGYFNLLPGETRILSVDCDKIKTGKLQMRAEAFNMSEKILYR